MDPNGNTVDKSLCDQSLLDNVEPCKTPDCQPWSVSPWDTQCPSANGCAATNIVQKRQVTCNYADPLNDCNQNPLSDTNPLGKPSDTNDCKNAICSSWYFDPIAPCPSTCSSTATQTNQTYYPKCPTGQICDPNNVPQPKIVTCNIPACAWVAPDFDLTVCPKNCGMVPSVIKRTVTCVTGNDADCANSGPKPTDSYSCPISPCQWKYGSWSGDPNVLPAP